MTEETDQQLTDEQRQQQQQQRQDSFQATNVQIGMLFAPFIALAVVALFGILAGANLPGTLGDKVTVAVVGAVVGTLLFVVLTDFVLSTQYPEATEENFLSEQTLEFANVATTAVGTAVASAVLTAAGAFLGDRIDASGGSL